MMNDQKLTVRARISALALAIAITTAAVMALASADRSDGRRASPMQPSAQRTEAAGFVCGLELLPSALETDPELSRLDRANEHHG
jgi:hypothetical protein